MTQAMSPESNATNEPPAVTDFGGEADYGI